MEDIVFPFKLCQFELSGLYYSPLPKMTLKQSQIVERRLLSLGFRLSPGGTLRASRGEVRINVDRAGLCWSNRDLVDLIAPAIPEILAEEKEVVPLEVLEKAYFDSEKRGSGSLLRLKPRLESSSHWSELRADGSCALTPDEHAVFAFILSSSSLLTELPTDFPVEGSRVRRIGKRQYYDSYVDAAEAVSTLRVLGAKGTRNTYLPKNSILRVSSVELSRRALKDLFGSLGEWCYLRAR